MCFCMMLFAQSEIRMDKRIPEMVPKESAGAHDEDKNCHAEHQI